MNTNTLLISRLKKQKQRIEKNSLQHLFSLDKERHKNFVLENDTFLFDYSRNFIDEEVLRTLLQLAEDTKIQEHIEKLFCGQKVNFTEEKPALHTELRDTQKNSLQIQKMYFLYDRISHGQWKGSTGKPIKNIVNLGIGGSDLGVRMVCKALKHFNQGNYQIQFVSNIDTSDIYEIFTNCNPEETLFLIASKSFTTQETLENAILAKQWLYKTLQEKVDFKKHFIALTASSVKAEQFGLPQENILSFADWVGGRFSICSVVGFPLLCLLGKKNYQNFLRGFYDMDIHFRYTQTSKNIPIILALLHMWYRNFWNTHSNAVLVYNQNLELFPAYLQQLEMESNGKSINEQGEKISYATAPVIWGGVGTSVQHSFFQMLHQGTDIIPCDFITCIIPEHETPRHQQILFSHFLAQQHVLSFGVGKEEIANSTSKYLLPHCLIMGNKPSNAIIMDALTPHNLGKLMAIYEHKVFTMGTLWNINPFDQWGVERGKKMAQSFYEILNYSHDIHNQHPDMQKQIAFFKKNITKK